MPEEVNDQTADRWQERQAEGDDTQADPVFSGKPDGDQGYYAIYNEHGEEPERTLARFPMTLEGEIASKQYLANTPQPDLGSLSCREEALEDIFAVSNGAFNNGSDANGDNHHFKPSWQVHFYYGDAADEPGEVIYGGFTTPEDAENFANAYPDGDDYEDVTIEQVNLVVFH